MDYRFNISVAAIILSSAFLINSLQTATASMPVGMQHGQFPYEHFTECDLPTAVAHSTNLYCSLNLSSINTGYTLFTVPSDRIFIVTQAKTTNSDCNFTSGGFPLIAQHFIDDDRSGLSGNGHIVLPAGASLEVYMRNASYCPFFLEGYYAHL